ncbi:MAG TPA: MarR family winged helix-turn-helix transcriptional regulator [Steroidobacteraceae bacterium]|nr:MarR family winged helix-turn-helix transcriptional regulator [Steroidobacteraceae bacterium]
MRVVIRRLAPLRLRASEATVLCLIEANPGITQSEIGRMLNIARANMAPLVARLAAIKLIERRAVDGRSHGLRMTLAGHTMARKVGRAIRAHEAQLQANIPASQRKALLAALHALARRHRRYHERMGVIRPVDRTGGRACPKMRRAPPRRASRSYVAC